MATVTYTPRYSQLPDWPGRLLQADDTTTVVTRSATAFTFEHGADSNFSGFRIQVTGTGFTYRNGVPVDGTISQVRIVNDAGQTVLTIGGLASNVLAGDLSQFYANAFGSPFDDAGPGPDGYMAWNHLLSGNDVVNGTSGDDRQDLIGLDAGQDTYKMGAGDDFVAGGIGNDTYFGGSGDDVLSFQKTTFNEGGSATRGATINVNAGTVLDPWGGSDKFSGFEEFEGSRFNDRFVGSNTERDYFSGLRGKDRIDGGDVTFDSGGDQTDDDRDRVDYQDDYRQGGQFGIVADLETSLTNGSIRGTIRDGFGNTDTVIDIENVSGTQFRDSFIGSRVGNSFYGGEGRDTFVGGGGRDEIIFDQGFRQDPSSGVNVDLNLATGQVINDGFGNTENATGFELIVGTDRNDRIRMNNASNEIAGLDGQDILTGRGGSDTFVFEGDHTNDGDRITDFAATGAAADLLAFEIEDFANMTTTLRLVNGNGATTSEGTFLFINATDELIWDSNGNQGGGREVIVTLTGVSSLSAGNFDLWD